MGYLFPIHCNGFAAQQRAKFQHPARKASSAKKVSPIIVPAGFIDALILANSATQFCMDAVRCELSSAAFEDSAPERGSDIEFPVDARRALSKLRGRIFEASRALRKVGPPPPPGAGDRAAWGNNMLGYLQECLTVIVWGDDSAIDAFIEAVGWVKFLDDAKAPAFEHYRGAVQDYASQIDDIANQANGVCNSLFHFKQILPEAELG